MATKHGQFRYCWKFNFVFKTGNGRSRALILKENETMSDENVDQNTGSTPAAENSEQTGDQSGQDNSGQSSEQSN